VQLFEVRADMRMDRSIQDPSTDRANGYHGHTWGGRGFRFFLLIGAQVPAFPGITLRRLERSSSPTAMIFSTR
jgi:hypothetical protein